MNIINIYNKLIGSETNSVNAKELHIFIQAKIRFNDWINLGKSYEILTKP